MEPLDTGARFGVGAGSVLPSPQAVIDRAINAVAKRTGRAHGGGICLVSGATGGCCDRFALRQLEDELLELDKEPPDAWPPPQPPLELDELLLELCDETPDALPPPRPLSLDELLELDEELPELELDDDELLELELDEELLELDEELLLELDEELLELDEEELDDELLELDDELLLELDDELLELDEELLLELDEELLLDAHLLDPSSSGPTRPTPAYVQAASCVIPALTTPPASSLRNARRSL
ncbi:MAG: hypothetical protein OXN97_07825 [Bryobacterales bacterium]|nr:hypothetical protein [Bryobacterales bacterium]